MKTTTGNCPKCGGSGNIPAFNGIANGVCFRCGGTGSVVIRETKANRYSEINAMHCKTLAEAQAYRLAEFVRRFPELVEALNQNAQAMHNVKNGCGKLRWVCEELSK